MGSFPFLTVIVFTPLVAFALIMLLPKERGENARMLGLAAMVVSLILSIYIYAAYAQQLPPSSALWRDTLLFVEEYNWLPSMNIAYIVGVDGLSATLVLLTSIVGMGGVLISWSIDDRPREFYAFFMLLVAGVQGVFVAVDSFLLFFFYELAVLPMYVMIVIWGWKERREYAAMKLTLYLLIGSFISIIFFLVAYFNMDAAIRTFDLRVWADYNFDRTFQIWMFLPIFMGFAVLGGTFPFHNWSPIGHLAAPTAVSMIHAGVLMKLGAYAAMRVGIQLFPEGAVYWMPAIILLTLINVIYGSLIAMRQTDLKYMIGYSSVSHMGLVAMGFAAMNVEGFTGAGIQMVSHGIMTALFFAVVGMIYDRAHTRNMEELGGMMKVLPWPMVAFVMASLVSMGMPGLSGFIAEFPIFLGVWQGGALDLSGLTTGFNLNPANFYPWVALISVLGIVITAAYLVRAIGNVFLGEYDEHKWHDMRPILPIDKVVLVSFVLVMVAIGMFPEIIEPIVRSGIDPVVNRLDQAREAATLLDSVHVAATNFFSWLGGGA